MVSYCAWHEVFFTRFLPHALSRVVTVTIKVIRSTYTYIRSIFIETQLGRTKMSLVYSSIKRKDYAPENITLTTTTHFTNMYSTLSIIIKSSMPASRRDVTTTKTTTTTACSLSRLRSGGSSDDADDEEDASRCDEERSNRVERHRVRWTVAVVVVSVFTPNNRSDQIEERCKCTDRTQKHLEVRGSDVIR